MKMAIRYAVATLGILTTLGCGSDTPPQWQHDAAMIERMLPRLGDVESTVWIYEPRYESSGLSVPGPMDYNFEGYVRLTEDAADKLQSSYQWTPATIGDDDIRRTEVSDLDEQFQGGLPRFESVDLLNNTRFSSEPIYLSPESGIVYCKLSVF